MSDLQNPVQALEAAFEAGDFGRMRKLLPELLLRKVPAAVRIAASISEESEPDDEFERRHVAGMFEAASLGDIKAQYAVGVFHDVGEYGVARNVEKAAKIFADLALVGHVRCMWIHAIDLINGYAGISRNESEGISLLLAAAEAGSAEACMTLAEFHDAGSHGFAKSIQERDRFRARAIEHDETTFDPYV